MVTISSAIDFTIDTQATAQNNGNVIDGNDSLTITENGSVTTNGNNAILATGTNNNFTNRGKIRAIGDAFDGIRVINSNTITNIGTVDASGVGSVAISVFDNNTINNSGSVTSTGDNSIGLLINNSSIINNYGTITTSGTGATGIIANNNNIINQFGRINVAGDAFLLLNNNTLNLHAGSQINGAFNLGTNTILNIHTSPAHSFNWIFNPTQIQGNAPNIVGSVPVFQNLISATRLQVTTLGPTTSGAFHHILAQVTGNLSNLMQQRLEANSKEHADFTSPNEIRAVKRIDSAFEAASNATPATWLSLLGSHARYREDASLEYQVGFAGIAGGYDWSPAADVKIGLIGGFMQGNVAASNGLTTTVDEDLSGFYAGIYGRKDFASTFIDFTVTGGIFDHSQRRPVNSNLNSSNANSDYSSTWISPEIALGLHRQLTDGWVASPSARYRYASQWIDSYAETGALTTKVGSQQVEIAEVSIEWAATKTTHAHETTLRAGYFHRTSFGDETNSVTLFGQTRNISISSEDKSAAYLAVNSNVHLNNNLDLQFGTRLEMGEEFTAIQGDVKLVARF